MKWAARDMSGWATIGLFLIVCFAAVATARDFLMPVTFAILLFFVFAPFRRWMERRGVAEWISASIVITGLIALLTGVALLLMGPASQLIDSVPTFARPHPGEVRRTDRTAAAVPATFGAHRRHHRRRRPPPPRPPP